MRQIWLYAQPTARMSPLMAQISQKLVRLAKKNASPSTYRRLVPQSPNSRPAAWNHETFRGRSLDSSDNARGLSPELDVCINVIDAPAIGRWSILNIARRGPRLFQTPTGLADGLGGESLPRLVPIRPCQLRCLR